MVKRNHDLVEESDDEEDSEFLTIVEQCQKAENLMNGRRALSQKDAAEAAGVKTTQFQR
jgi:hypothetical protein